MYDRAALLAATSLPDLADELLGPRTGSQRSPSWPCPNPGHAQTGRTPPLNVFRTRWGEERWRCFGCGAGGSAIDLVLATHGGATRDAFDFLSARTGVRPDSPAQPLRSVPPRRPEHRDPSALATYVETCAKALWAPAGRPILRWLTDERSLPTGVLRTNRIGADVGGDDRPDGMPRAAGALLPTFVDDEPIYAQIRVLRPGPGRPRYLNPSWDMAENPKMSRIEPVDRRHDEIVVTEGVIDALSAASAGYVAVAFCGCGAPDAVVALALARLPGPLVVAFDPDSAGEAGVARLSDLLAAHRRSATRLQLPGGDLNDHLRDQGSAWLTFLSEAVDSARAPMRSSIGLGT